jgi:uncharacterized protein (DUF1015 family)
MKIIPFPAIVPDLGKITADEAFFNSVKKEYLGYAQKGLFQKSGVDAFYIYEIQTRFSSHIGVVAALDLDDYREGKVKKHENTLLEKEKVQMELLLHRKAMVKPILLTYRHSEAIDKALVEIRKNAKPFFEVNFEKIKQKHLFWQLTDADTIAEIKTLFENNIPCCYLADGHHRLSSNLLLEHQIQYNGKDKFDEALCAFFADSQLLVKPFHRVFSAPNINESDVISAISAYADSIQPRTNAPAQKGEWSMCIKGKWSSWRWKNEVVDTYRANRHVVLDVDILNDKILHEALGVEDIRSDRRISYVEEKRGTAALEKLSHSGVVFRLYPVDIEDLMTISDDNDIMPPKSTFFEPRLLNGLLIQELPEGIHA